MGSAAHSTYDRAVRAESAGDADEAVSLYRESARLGSAAAAYQLGWLLQHRDDYAGAATAFEQASRAGDDDATVLLALLLIEHLDRADDGVTLFRDAIARGHPRARVYLGVALAEAGRPDEAEKVFREAIATGEAEDAQEPNAHQELALLLTGDRDEEALAEHRRAAELGVADAWVDIAISLVDLERFEEAEAAAHEALTRTGDVRAHRVLGTVCFRQTRYEEAESHYRQGIADGDDYALVECGDLLASLDRFEEAEAMYRQALERELSEVHLDLAELYRRLDRTKDAADEYRAAVAAGHRHGHLGLADLLAGEGRTAEAEAERERAREPDGRGGTRIAPDPRPLRSS